MRCSIGLFGLVHGLGEVQAGEALVGEGVHGAELDDLLPGVEGLVVLAGFDELLGGFDVGCCTSWWSPRRSPRWRPAFSVQAKKLVWNSVRDMPRILREDVRIAPCLCGTRRASSSIVRGRRFLRCTCRSSRTGRRRAVRSVGFLGRTKPQVRLSMVKSWCLLDGVVEHRHPVPAQRRRPPPARPGLRSSSGRCGCRWRRG